MHLKDTANTLFLSFCSIQYIRTGVQCTGIHTEEREFSNEWIGHDLKCQCCEWFIIRRTTNYFVSFIIYSGDIRDIGRSWHEFDNAIQHFLNTLVLICRSTIYRNCLTSDGSFTKNFLKFINCRFFTFQIFLKKVIIQLTDFLNQVVVPFLGKIFQIIRDLCDFDVFTFVIFVVICFHLEQVYQSDEIIFFSDWDLYRNCIFTKTVNNGLNRHEEICSHFIHFINERHTRYIVCVSLTPNIF